VRIKHRQVSCCMQGSSRKAGAPSANSPPRGIMLPRDSRLPCGTLQGSHAINFSDSASSPPQQLQEALTDVRHLEAKSSNIADADADADDYHKMMMSRRGLFPRSISWTALTLLPPVLGPCSTATSATASEKDPAVASTSSGFDVTGLVAILGVLVFVAFGTERNITMATFAPGDTRENLRRMRKERREKNGGKERKRMGSYSTNRFAKSSELYKQSQKKKQR